MVSKAKKPVRKPRATKAKKTTKVEAAPVAPPAAPVKVAAKKTPVKDEVTLADAFVHVLGQLTSLRSQLTNITGQVRVLAKRALRSFWCSRPHFKRDRSRKNTVALFMFLFLGLLNVNVF